LLLEQIGFPTLDHRGGVALIKPPEFAQIARCDWSLREMGTRKNESHQQRQPQAQQTVL
jgi:hypothetical protein